MKLLFLKDCVCGDVSDERNCRIVYTDPEKYLQSKPPPSDTGKLPVFIKFLRIELSTTKYNKLFLLSCNVMVILDIQEVGQFIELKFELAVSWRDSRVLFYNIKQDESMKSLTLREQLDLWSPTMIFWNTKEQLKSIN